MMIFRKKKLQRKKTVKDALKSEAIPRLPFGNDTEGSCSSTETEESSMAESLTVASHATARVNERRHKVSFSEKARVRPIAPRRYMTKSEKALSYWSVQELDDIFESVENLVREHSSSKPKPSVYCNDDGPDLAGLEKYFPQETKERRQRKYAAIDDVLELQSLILDANYEVDVPADEAICHVYSKHTKVDSLEARKRALLQRQDCVYADLMEQSQQTTIAGVA